MKAEYEVINASNATVPHMAVVWGSNSTEPGEVVFTVEMGDQPLLVELAVCNLVSTANTNGGALLDGLIGQEVVGQDLPALLADLVVGREAFIRPSKFQPVDLNRVYKAIFNGGPSDLSEFAASMAIKDLMANWKAALADGSQIGSLTADVDEVIKHLTTFKSLCVEKPQKIDPAPFKHYLGVRRELEAVKAWESYDIGSGLGWQVESEEGCWRLGSEDHYMKLADATCGLKKARLTFHVRFMPNSFMIEECFALDLDTGFMI